MIVGCLESALLILQYDVVWVKHCLMLAFRVQSELLLAVSVRVLGAQFNYSLSELVRLKVF